MSVKHPDDRTKPQKLSWRKGCLTALFVLIAVCLVGIAGSWWSNRSLPTEVKNPDKIEPLDKIRLEEALHLKTSLGEALWTGFGSESIPVSLHYDQVSFLVGYPGEPPASWQVVAGDDFQGEAYFWVPEPDPQNFAIQVGDVWAAGMATKSMTDRFLIQAFHNFLPPVVRQVFPYRVLIQPSETQIGGVIHESFHVFQARLAPGRLEAAETAHRLGERYWAADATMRSFWESEVSLLSGAVNAGTDEEALRLAAEFLEARQQRRSTKNITTGLADYERWLEWEEGLAKYAEIKILKLAYESTSYQPIAPMQSDPDFKAYRGYPNRWSQENIQLKRQAGEEGETRFYQTGLAIAYLLDRFDPTWRDRALAEEVFLEDLLQAAIK